MLIELYENILNHYGDVGELRKFTDRIKTELRQQNAEDLIVRKKMSKKMEEYDGAPQHIKAIKNSNVELKRGATINMLYVKDSREVIHYDPELGLKFEIDFKKYFHDFLVKKIALIDETIHYKLFLEKTTLVDKSKLSIQNRIKKVKAVTGKLG